MRIDQITFSRFIAAVSIVVFHYGLNVFPFNVEFISSLFKQANVGVSYFFILSGFVMMIAYGNKSEVKWQEYYLNRLARIYPVYLLAILLLLIYKIIIQTRIDYSGLLLNVIAIQAWVCGDALSFNSPGWSLSVEFFFYLLFPFLMNRVYSKKSKYIFIVIVLFWLLSQMILNFGVKSNLYQPLPSASHDFFYYFPLMHLNEFLIGNLAGIFYLSKLKGKEKNYDHLIILGICILLFLLKYTMGLNFHNGVLAIIFIPLILLISLNNGILTTVFNSKFLVFLGEISYSVYILQFPVFFYSTEILQYLHVDNELLRFYLSLLTLILSAAISYKYIETPLRNYIKSLNTKVLV